MHKETLTSNGEDDDAAVAPFDCAAAVASFGCDTSWGGSTIGELLLQPSRFELAFVSRGIPDKFYQSQ